MVQKELSIRIDRRKTALLLKLTLSGVSSTDTKVAAKQTAPWWLETLAVQPRQDANSPAGQITAWGLSGCCGVTMRVLQGAGVTLWGLGVTPWVLQGAGVTQRVLQGVEVTQQVLQGAGLPPGWPSPTAPSAPSALVPAAGRDGGGSEAEEEEEEVEEEGMAGSINQIRGCRQEGQGRGCCTANQGCPCPRGLDGGLGGPVPPVTLCQGPLCPTMWQ